MEQGFDWGKLPRLSSEQAKLAGTLRQRLPGLLHEQRALLPHPPGCSDLPAMLGITGDWTLPLDKSVGFRWRGDGLDVSVRIAGPLALAAVDEVLGQAQDQARSARALTSVELGIYEYRILDWMSSLRAAVDDLPFPVLSDLASPPIDDDEAGPVITLAGRGESVAGQIQLRFHHCAESQITARRVSRQSPLYALPFDLAIEAGRAALNSQELRSIEVGDVIILDEAAASVSDEGLLSGRFALSAPGARRRGDVEIKQDGSFEIVELDTMEAVMSEPVNEEINEEASDTPELTTDLSDALAEDVELTLAAELGRLRLSLAHAASYEVGSVIRLGKPVGAEVDLTLAGRLVGRGELLNIDGELGVRVSQWSV
ncbi:MAG: type III secretion system cytoplasmic ring protein SctQ [Myxococcota bacterium]|nr:type III secretion system cytoplasmic ring protein SctQ [Myxococcota bacterium]